MFGVKKFGFKYSIVKELGEKKVKLEKVRIEFVFLEIKEYLLFLE